MARKLSDIEWATFISDINVPALNLPPWGGVVEWQGMKILVYVPAGGAEVWTTDVSAEPAVVANTLRVYDSTQQTWYYHLPEEIAKVSIERAKQAGQVLVDTADVLGQVAGGLTAPLIQELTLPLIVVGLVSLYFLYREMA